MGTSSLHTHSTHQRILPLCATLHLIHWSLSQITKTKYQRLRWVSCFFFPVSLTPLSHTSCLVDMCAAVFKLHPLSTVPKNTEKKTDERKYHLLSVSFSLVFLAISVPLSHFPSHFLPPSLQRLTSIPAPSSGTTNLDLKIEELQVAANIRSCSPAPPRLRKAQKFYALILCWSPLEGARS